MLPLEGFRIIDLTRVISGPFRTMLLADLGVALLEKRVVAGAAREAA